MTFTDQQRAALLNALSYADCQICRHENTHRGGIIWTICDDCGASFADDRGGVPENPWPSILQAALDAVDQQP